ncbi:hypothetical protein [Leptospira brenneri]|uniref:SGNH/GDSL hydrolase family protein n=1 Tax=Leptospira brenneri TaxID=2023182 RepID=A0A2M9XZZ1_9LEPT|nr:hypothetical protein [Leptospira brenneri]PJZ44852.1 hypothetical protein CH361_13215 [Leptospira brenneri]TGK96854.1 hypothetical protein EHQ30_09760 [Leptospira brenneri]
MKIRYWILTFVFLSLFMHLTLGWFIPFCETTSSYWYLSKTREGKTSDKIKVLVLGDSQIVSGVSPKLIAEIEGISLDEVLYLPRPSEQPEGILLNSLNLIGKLPNLKKIYVNLSPLNTSKNSITDSHKQLYHSFGTFSLNAITNPFLRKAYFSNLTDISWKTVITVFPYFGISSNLNRLVYDRSTQIDLPRRKEEYLFIKQSMHNLQGSWVWKSVGEDPTLQESEDFPNLNTMILSGKRELSIQLWLDCFKLWEKQKLEVVLLRIPFSPKMEKDILKTKANVVSDEIFKTVTSNSFQKNVVIFDFRAIFLEEYQYFADLTHLNQKGRDAFSLILKRSLFDHTRSSTKSM